MTPPNTPGGEELNEFTLIHFWRMQYVSNGLKDGSVDREKAIKVLDKLIDQLEYKPRPPEQGKAQGEKCEICEGTGELKDAVQAWDIPGAPIPECGICKGTGKAPAQGEWISVKERTFYRLCFAVDCAIYHEDGLDGSDGEQVLKEANEVLKKNGLKSHTDKMVNDPLDSPPTKEPK